MQAEVIETAKHKRLDGKKLETFVQFWEAFAYKTGKAEAADAWLLIPSLTDDLLSKIVSAAKMEAVNRPGIRESGKTPKMAQGWLSGRRWEDEPIKEKSNDRSGITGHSSQVGRKTGLIEANGPGTDFMS